VRKPVRRQGHADEVADIFIKELLRNGTTTALVFGSVHPQSVNSFFEAAERWTCG
jgi:guanine deaminase